MFYDKLKELRSEKSLKQSDISEMLNITPEAYTQYEKGKRKPNLENLRKLALIFNVSSDYLLELCEYRNIEEYLSAADDYFSNEERRFINLYRQLPENLRIEIKGIAEGMLRASGSAMYHPGRFDNGRITQCEKASGYIPVFYLPMLKEIKQTADRANGTGEGKTSAGPPAELNECDAGCLLVVDRYTEFNAYAVRVKGDSLKNANIENGDFLIIKPQPIVNDGDMALIDIDGLAAVRFFYTKNDRVELRPANPEYSSLVYGKDRNIRIIGKVIDKIKRLEAQII